MLYNATDSRCVWCEFVFHRSYWILTLTNIFNPCSPAFKPMHYIKPLKRQYNEIQELALNSFCTSFKANTKLYKLDKQTNKRSKTTIMRFARNVHTEAFIFKYSCSYMPRRRRTYSFTVIHTRITARLNTSNWKYE